jgi:O-antigen ligase
MTRRKPESAAPRRLAGFFSGAFGALLGVSLLKFGNPPIMSRLISSPSDPYEFILGSMWPLSWGYWLLAAVITIAFATRQTVRRPRGFVLWLPAVWLAWQVLAGTQTVDVGLTIPTLLHFTSTISCYYLGLICLSQVSNMRPFWTGLLVGFGIVLLVGWVQQFGGLAQTREYFFTYIYPTLKEIHPDYLKKMQSERVFSTLFYPNALAGVILLLLPPLLVFIASLEDRFTTGARFLLGSILVVAAMGCLYWSGSKGGWLIMLGLIVLALPRSSQSAKVPELAGSRLRRLLRFFSGKAFKYTALILLLVAGLSGFFWKYASFFQRGATSVSARFDYWSAALQTARTRPIFGTGPGTFGTAYQKVKRPESEPARLTHNDYLQQASDSGIPGFLLYTAFVGSLLIWTYPRGQEWLRFCTWLGLLGLFLQACIEFPLYLPALSLPAFALLGWLAGSRNRVDNAPRAR